MEKSPVIFGYFDELLNMSKAPLIKTIIKSNNKKWKKKMNPKLNKTNSNGKTI